MAKAYRQLHQMNGDYLTKLKRPLCSEFSPTIKGTLNARQEQHRKKVELMFKERNFMLNKFKRSQDAVYGTLLQVHKAKKIMQRESHKRHQGDVRLDFDDDRKSVQSKSVTGEVTVSNKTVTQDISVNIDNSGYTKTDSKYSDQDKQDEAAIGTTTASTKPIQKSKVLEVAKGSKAPPLVRERSQTLESNTGSNDGIEGAKSLMEPFPHIGNHVLAGKSTSEIKDSEESSETSPVSTQKRTKRKKKTKSQALPVLKEANKMKPPPPNAYLLTLQNGVAPLTAISEERSEGRSHENWSHQRQCHTTTNANKITDITEAAELRHTWPGPWTNAASSSSQSQNSQQQQLRYLQSSESLGSSSKRTSQIELNKQKAREKEVLMKKFFEEEPVVQYVLDEKGNVVRDIKDFSRRDFNPPSLKEKHFQRKMLSTEFESSLGHREKMEEFFDKIDIEDKEKMEQRRRQLAKIAGEKAALEEAEKEQQRSQDNIGVTLTGLIAAFNRPEELPDGVDPDSIEAVKVCKYTREYRPLTMTKEEKIKAKREKASSWGNAS